MTLKHVVASESTDVTCDWLEVHSTVLAKADFKSRSVHMNPAAAVVCLEREVALICLRAHESFVVVVVFAFFCPYFLHDSVASNSNWSRP